MGGSNPEFQAKLDTAADIPPEELARQKKIVDRCMGMVATAKPVTQQWARLWQDGQNYLYNNQLADKERGNHFPRVQINQIYPAAHQELALLASRKPKIEIEGSGPEQTDKATFWRGDLQYRYDKTLHMGLKTILASLDGTWSGWFIGYVYPEERAWWDEQRQKWVYEPKVELVHPLYFGLDPNAETFEDAQYVYCQKVMPVELALRTWPDRKAEIEKAATDYVPDDDPTLDMGFGMRAPAAQSKGTTEKGTAPKQDVEGELVGLINQARGGAPADRGGGAEAGKKVVLVTIVHYRDYDEEDGEELAPYSREELEQGGALTLGADNVFHVGDPAHPAFERTKTNLAEGDVLSRADWPHRVVRDYKKPKYPYGRVVYILGGDVLLNPEDKDQRWDRRKWPYVVGKRLPLPHVPQGLNSVEMARSSQDWINVVWSHILNWVKNFADPARRVEKQGLLGKVAELGNKIKIMAGQVFEVKTGSKGVEFISPPELPQGLLQVTQFMTKQTQDSMSQHDNAMGAPAPTDQTATASSIQQAATQTSVGLSMVFLDAWILAVMEQVAELDAMYLEAGDAVRLAGTSDTPEQWAEYCDEYADLDFDIKLDVGVALPHDVERRKLDTERLFQMFASPPPVPALWALAAEAFNVPDKKKFLDSITQYQQFQAWQQQQALLAQEMAQQQAQAAEAGAVPGAAGQPTAPGQGVPPAIAMGG